MGVAGADGADRSAGPITALGGFVLILVGVLALREVASLVLPVIFGLFIALIAWPMVGSLSGAASGVGSLWRPRSRSFSPSLFLAAGVTRSP